MLTFNLLKRGGLTVLLLLLALLFDHTLIHAQVAGAPPEVFVGGKKYRSIQEYRDIQKELLTQKTQKAAETEEGREADALRASFLDLMLEKLSDDEIKQLLHDLKQKKQHLFFDVGYDPGIAQMKRMISDYAVTHGKDVGLNFDPAKVKTIYIAPPKPPDEEIFSAQEANMMLKTDAPGGLTYPNFDLIVQQFKMRDEGLLSNKFKRLETVDIKGILEIFKESY